MVPFEFMIILAIQKAPVDVSEMSSFQMTSKINRSIFQNVRGKNNPLCTDTRK